MASKVAALVRNFLQTDGDALYLVPGEKIFISRGTARAVAGREIVSEESFRAVVDELIPGVPAETLAQKRNRVPYVAGPGLSPVEIHFATIGGSPAMMIVRPGRGPGGEAPRTPAPAPSPRPPEVPEAPRAVGEGGAAAATAPAAPPEAEERVTGPRGPRAAGVVPLLALAREKGASDLYVTASEKPLARVQGSLAVLSSTPAGDGDVDAFLSGRVPAHAAKVLAGIGSSHFVVEVEGAGRCLVRLARDRKGTALAVRLLSAEAPRLDSLGLPEAVARLAGPAPGLLLVAGPPGSGRTTTLAAFAAHAAQGRGERVVALEDPVELVIRPGRGSVSQREAGTDVPSIRAGLRAVATEDADVVLLGAIPDAASAALAVELAASGRLVLASVPATSIGVGLQWLDATLPDGRRAELRALLAQTFRGGLALALCRGRRGGRVAAAETLHPGSLVADLVLGGGLAALPGKLREEAGYGSLNGSLARLVAAGLVDAREALIRSLDRPALLAQLREEGADLPPELVGGAPGG